jgi:hypothetical protein
MSNLTQKPQLNIPVVIRITTNVLRLGEEAETDANLEHEC